MSSLRNSSFRDQDEAISHMVKLLSAEAETSGTLLNEKERDTLTRECRLPPNVRDKAKKLIRRIFDREELMGETDVYEHLTSFGNSLKWVADAANPNIVELTRQVVAERSPYPELHGWRLVFDRALLFVCGVGVIALIFAAGYFFSK